MKRILCLLIPILCGCGPAWPKELPFEEKSSSLNISSPVTESKQGWFKIVVLDVGQGDATLLVSPEGDSALIDTGPPDKGAEVILSVLKDLNIPKVQKIFISHYHEDHIGGLEALVKNSLEAEIVDKKSAKAGSTLSLGDITIRILAANGQIGNQAIPAEAMQDENNLSLALLIEYGKFRYFTDGDLPGGGGEPPYQTLDLETPLAPLVGDIDVMLIPHHGSHTSTNENFLNTLKPEAAIISLGNENDFFHPHPSVIERLKKAEAKIYLTERGSLRDTDDAEVVGGSICIVTNGETYQVKPHAVDKCATP